MTQLNTTVADQAHNLLDCKVVDQNGNDFGTVHSFWADPQSGKLQFFGVKTGWLFGQNHVIPVDKAELDEANRTVRVPYATDFIKDSVSIDADSEISDEQEQEIYRYYNMGGRTTTVNTAASTNTAMTDRSAATASNITSTETRIPARDTANASTSDKDTIEVPLSAEELKVGKRTVSAGQVRLRKIVRTEVVNQPVEIRHEDVVVERIPASEVRGGAVTSDFKEQTIDMPLTREEAVVSKESHVTGAVRLNKTSESETQNVSETLRKEDVEVLRDGKTVSEERDLRK